MGIGTDASAFFDGVCGREAIDKADKDGGVRGLIQGA